MRFNRIARKTGTRHVITETRLNKIIEEEVLRKQLIKEGFIDSIKSSFKKVDSKVRQEFAKKIDDALGKLEKFSSSLESGPTDEIESFLSALKEQEGGGSPEEIMTQVPEYATLAKEIKEIELIDIEVISSEEASEKSESISRNELATQLILLDEDVFQKMESHNSYRKTVINESFILGALAAWWSFEKTVVGGLGLLYWSLKFISWVLSKFGKKGAAKKCKEYADKVHHVEEAVIELTAIPPHLQYAAYAAYMKVKGEKSMSYKEFVDPRNKEGKEAKKMTFKILKFALFIPMIIDAAYHLMHSLVGALDSFKEAALAAKYGAKTASETGAAVKSVASLADIGKAGAEIGKAGAELGRAGITAVQNV